MEKTRYYAIKGPDGELQPAISSNEEAVWYELFDSNLPEARVQHYKQAMIEKGYRCVEVAEVKEEK